MKGVDSIKPTMAAEYFNKPITVSYGGTFTPKTITYSQGAYCFEGVYQLQMPHDVILVSDAESFFDDAEELYLTSNALQYAEQLDEEPDDPNNP